MSGIFRHILRRSSTKTEPDAEKGLADGRKENEEEDYEILESPPVGDDDEPQTQGQSSSDGSDSQYIHFSDGGNGPEGSRRPPSIDPAHPVSRPSRRNTRNSRRPTST